jgi:hypothetical protein
MPTPNDLCGPFIKDMKENTMENQSADMCNVSNPTPPPRASDTGSNHGLISLDEDEAVEQKPDQLTPRKRRVGVGGLLMGRNRKN